MGKIEIYKDKKLEWRWRIKARNGKILADSGEGYNRKAMCLKYLDQVITRVDCDEWPKIFLA